MGLGSVVKVVGKLPWWVLSKGVLGGAGTVASGVGMVVHGNVLEGIAAIGVGISMIGQRHKQEKMSK
jgi:hypothetical protein